MSKFYQHSISSSGIKEGSCNNPYPLSFRAPKKPSRNRGNETSLPVKKDFYNSLSIEKTTESDDLQAKRIFEDFKTKTSGQCQNL